MPLETLLIVIATISATGLVSNSLRRSGHDTALITLRGPRPRNLLSGFAIWTISFGITIALASLMWIIAPTVVALPISFALLALALEFCMTRIEYLDEDSLARTSSTCNQYD